MLSKNIFSTPTLNLANMEEAIIDKICRIAKTKNTTELNRLVTLGICIYFFLGKTSPAGLLAKAVVKLAMEKKYRLCLDGLSTDFK